LYLIEPPPSPAWAPFAGARAIADLRAGVWTIRERWEAAADRDCAEILGVDVAHLHDPRLPACRAPHRIEGPAVIGGVWFAPTGAPLVLTEGARRLVAGERTVGWIISAGETWSGPTETGATVPVEGVLLRGSFDLITALEQLLAPDCAALAGLDCDPLPSGSIVIGDPALVASRGASVEPGVVFDTRNGAVLLEPGVEVRHGSRLEGPLYAGERTRILGGHLRASVFGPRSSVKGEISTSVVLGYANKSHDGFVGHSVIGEWVNLGAGTTTSNLKNTYGEVALTIGGQRLRTGRQFLGSLIGDHAKTAIGTLLATGTVVGTGANVFGDTPPPKYVRPFSWGNEGVERVTEQGFLKVAERVMSRRDVAITPQLRTSLQATYRRLVTA
jgi:UDP-N-acetylglucosamine diphosphorylase/glucosamine-1-phosphate N-acetyltransferase